MYVAPLGSAIDPHVACQMAEAPCWQQTSGAKRALTAEISLLHLPQYIRSFQLATPHRADRTRRIMNGIRAALGAVVLACAALVGLDPPASAGTDWSTAMVNSTMARYSPSQIGGWSYPVGLYLYGQYLVYQRTHDPRYLAYIKSWADRFVDGKGDIDQSFGSL